MKVDELEKIINDAFEDRQNISDTSNQKILDAINETINLTDKGSVRVAEKKMEIGLSINGLKRLFC